MSTALAPIEGRDNLSLYQIESDLQELMAAYGEAEDDATRQAIHQGIQEYATREVVKVDGIRSYLRHCEVMAVAAKCEADAQMERSRKWKRRAEKLEAICLSTMIAMGKKRLEGKSGELIVKTNGGAQALDITEPSIVPDEYCLAQVTMSCADWDALYDTAGKPVLVGSRVDRVPDSAAIRAALKAPCWLCAGKDQDCDQCGGTGTSSVPGARLRERGVHLEVK
jgi:hypothetical protein